MNKIERKDLVAGALYWYVEYQGDSIAPTQTLVQVLEVNPTYRLLDVLEDKVIHALLIYTHFEPLHPGWLEANIKSIKAEQIRLARKIQVLENFV